MHELNAISSLDGRYAETVAPLRAYFSEFAFFRDRLRVELDYLEALSRLGLFRPLTTEEGARLGQIKSSFSLEDAEAIRAHEQRTRHDVKALEYFLQEQLRGSSLEELIPWLHFGLTSEDTNSIGQALALHESRQAVMLPALDELLGRLRELALDHKALPMLARTHGQWAVPTTLGRELAVFYSRLAKLRAAIASHRFEAKLTGAVGAFNALQAAAPQVDWASFAQDFISRYGLDPQLFTTQILPYDNWIGYFDLLRLLNSVLLDLAQDTWRYISDGYLRQAVVEGEVGSSTMPQKVNPIDFENAEGNLGLANALLAHYAQKLPVSRLQRDLSDSTVRRTFGSALGHSLVAWTGLLRGLGRIAPDEERMRADLDSHWEVVAEGAQTVLRMAGNGDAYESLKERTRGQTLTQEAYRTWCQEIDVDEVARARLLELSPAGYTGLAEQLVERLLA